MAQADTELQQGSGALEMSDFSSLLQKEFKPQSDKAKESVEVAVRTLAEQALAGTNLVSGDVLATISGLIAALDRKLTEQINLIMHSEQFQALEGAWRGLHHLVNNTETDDPRHEHFEERPGQDAQEVQGHGLGSESDLQEDV
jgi:type VI secretion system protein ImpC